MGAVVIGGRAVTGKGLPLVVGEIVMALGIVVIAHILIAGGDLELVALNPLRVRLELPHLVEALIAAHWENVAADQAIVDKGRGIAVGAQARWKRQGVAAWHNNAIL